MHGSNHTYGPHRRSQTWLLGTLITKPDFDPSQLLTLLGFKPWSCDVLAAQAWAACLSLFPHL